MNRKGYGSRIQATIFCLLNNRNEVYFLNKKSFHSRITIDSIGLVFEQKKVKNRYNLV